MMHPKNTARPLASCAALLFLAILLAGCVTSPAPEGKRGLETGPALSPLSIGKQYRAGNGILVTLSSPELSRY